MACCTDVINPREFYIKGDISVATLSDPGTGSDEEVWADTIVGLRSKLLNPLKTDGIEVFELDQQVAKQKSSWLVRSTPLTRAISTTKTVYTVDGDRYHIVQVRRYKGGRRYLVLDSVHRDNDTLG
jgi:hypothetical protein